MGRDPIAIGYGLALLPLSRGRVALIAETDARIVAGRSWRAHQTGPRKSYVSTSIAGKKVYLHRLLTDCAAGFEVDHINGDTLDNRRDNLRVCSIEQNRRNRRKIQPGKHTSFKGVRLGNRGCRWRAAIKTGGRTVTRGGFLSPEAAAREYDRMARQLFGEFASLNFPNEPA